MISYPINNNTFVKFTRPSSDESHQMTWHIVQTCSVCECLVFRESSPFFPPFCHQPWQHILFLSTLNEKNISFFAIAPFVRVPFHTTPSMLEAFIADRHDLCWNSTSALIAKVLLVLEHKRLIHNYKLLNWELQLYKKKTSKFFCVVSSNYRFAFTVLKVDVLIWFWLSLLFDSMRKTKDFMNIKHNCLKLYKM